MARKDSRGRRNRKASHAPSSGKSRGHAYDLDKDVKRFYLRYGLNNSFPKGAIKEAKALSKAGLPEKQVGDRKDFTHLKAFTIDPEDARDFDDALSVEIVDEKEIRIGVHIADVSAWVKPRSEIDREARKRGNSYYFPWGFVPMLPERLTCDVCSLVPGEERLAFSCLYAVRNGRIRSHRFCKSVIRSRKRLTYREAQRILDRKKSGATPHWLTNALDTLQEIAGALRQKRARRGGLDFEIPEHGVAFDDSGFPCGFPLHRIYESNRIVEDFMLETNERAAALLQNARHPTLYRNHESPTPSDLAALQDLCEPLGIHLRGKTASARFRSALRAVSDTANPAMYCKSFLRTMPKAKYEPANKGHFGIGAPVYSHFTSPIRRYVDLTVHRSLAKALTEGSPQSPWGRKSRKRSSRSAENLAGLGGHLSLCEETAQKMERESIKWLACEYMYSRTGKTCVGLISGFCKFGMFVELSDIPVEGLVLRRFLRFGSFKMNARNQTLTGPGKRTWSFGDPVQVYIKRCDPARRQLDVMLTPDQPLPAS